MLPRLLYLGDVPVEASYHGRAFLYRLLERYPADRLHIVEAGLVASEASRRLMDVRYDDRRPPFLRLARTRFAALYWSLFLLLARARARSLMSAVREFKPDAILSVGQGLSCVTAAALAARSRVPLHLICHDPWSIHTAVCGTACGERIFGDVYRAAASRLCISPYMAEAFEKRYHARGSVLYPLRASDTAVFEQPPERLGRTTTQFTCAFAGTVNNRGYAAALKQLAECLIPFGGRLLIFGAINMADAESLGLTGPNIEIGEAPSSRALIAMLRERADVLFVPMSFAQQDRTDMEISFPSKLSDYTAAALPLLIYGPEYCSAVRWAKANAPVAEVVTIEGGEGLSQALKKLASDPGQRMQLAQAAAATGNRYFSYEAAFGTFTAALGAEAGCKHDIRRPELATV